MLPKVTHPTNRANYYMLLMPGITIWYSYETPIAFWTLRNGHVIRQNDFSRTTGKHLNMVDPDKSVRVPTSEFERKLQLATELPNVWFS